MVVIVVVTPSTAVTLIVVVVAVTTRQINMNQATTFPVIVAVVAVYWGNTALTPLTRVARVASFTTTHVWRAGERVTDGAAPQNWVTHKA